VFGPFNSATLIGSPGALDCACHGITPARFCPESRSCSFCIKKGWCGLVTMPDVNRDLFTEASTLFTSTGKLVPKCQSLVET